MNSDDLEREFAAAVNNVRQPHLDRMAALGVNSNALARCVHYAHPFGVMDAEPRRDGTYEAGAGTPHIVLPVYEGEGMVDLVAWRSDNPARWWLRTGLGWMLNANDIFNGWHCELTLHSTPLDWLQAGGNGGVVLDWSSPDIRWLRGVAAIDCDTAHLAAMVRRELSKPARMPTIRARDMRHAA